MSFCQNFDLSDWLNGVVSVCGGGDVQLTLLPPMCFNLEHVKMSQMENRKRVSNILVSNET